MTLRAAGNWALGGWAVLAASVLLAADGAAPPERTIRGTPWHLVDLWWDRGAAQPFESLAIDVAIADDVPPEVNLYVAPVGIAHLDKTPFYGGIQTNADGNTRADPRLRKIGPGFLMSMWGERSLEAIRPSDGGLLQSSGHEGDFVSVRRPFAWKKGKFTYRVVRMERQTIQGRPYRWVGAFVRVHATDENIFIGALRFPGDELTLAHNTASFVEIYGRAIPFDQIPRVTVTFDNLRVNDEPAALARVTAIYPQDVPDYAAALWQDGAAVVCVGEAVPNRQERRQRLHP